MWKDKLTESLQEQPSRSRWTSIKDALRRHVYFVGPGIVAAVAYADPGNWATDLQAGSEYGYSLLFIVLLTGLFAVFIQILSCRLGVITETDLARHCRMLILKEDRNGRPTQVHVPHLKWRRFALLYPLYAIVEGAIVATELAELTGSAIALNLLFPGLPLWGGILVTSVDVILILFLYRPPPNASFRILEAFIACLVIIVVACFIVLLVRIKPYWPDVFHGYLPSRNVVSSGALYVSVGILGATVMPHAIILGSHFASIDRLPPTDPVTDTDEDDKPLDDNPASPSHSRWTLFSHAISRLFAPKNRQSRDTETRANRGLRAQCARMFAKLRLDPEAQEAIEHAKLPPRSLRRIRLHIKHASVDIALSLMAFAITINSAILIVSAAAFYYRQDGQGNIIVAGLYDAFNLLKAQVGNLSAILFAIGLLAAGQSASITCTLAGQLVSEGFINWRTDPFLRRIVTRLVAVIPSLAVSIAVGKDGLDEMLVASQVALSIALPFVLLPLIIVTGRSSVMTVKQSVDQQIVLSPQNDTSNPTEEHVPSLGPDVIGTPVLESAKAGAKASTTPEITSAVGPSPAPVPQEISPADDRVTLHNFRSPWPIQGLAYAIFGVIVVADVYVLYTTFAGI